MKFQGFVLPESNYFRLPNEWTNITHSIRSLAELKVVEYILRHTWGYNGKEKESKKITTDEFVNGRKKKDGSRMDKGTGLSAPSVIDGLKRAVEHGYVEVEIDDRDLGRIKKSYYLVLRDSDPKDLGSSYKDSLDPDIKILNSGYKDSLDRSGKDNLGKTTKKEKGGRSVVPAPQNKGLLRNGKSERKLKKKKPNPHLSNFDRKAAAELKVVLDEHNVIPLKNARRDTIGKQILRLQKEGIEKKQIREMILWLGEHYGEDYVPRLRRADDIYNKFVSIVDQMKESKKPSRINGKKITRDNMYDSDNCINGIPQVYIGNDGNQYDGDLLTDVQQLCRKQFGPQCPDQDEVDRVLKELGREEEKIPCLVVGRSW